MLLMANSQQGNLQNDISRRELDSMPDAPGQCPLANTPDARHQCSCNTILELLSMKPFRQIA